jgi:hypothetical protein
MRLIKNHDTEPSSAHRQNPRQEASTVNTIPPDAELDELFSFHDDPEFLVGSAQGRAELRRLVLGSPRLKGGGSAAGSGTASTVETSDVETTAPAIPPTHPRHLTLSRPWVRWTLAGTAAALAAITCAIGISLSNTSQDTAQTRPPDARTAIIPVAANPQAVPPLDQVRRQLDNAHPGRGSQYFPSHTKDIQVPDRAPKWQDGCHWLPPTPWTGPQSSNGE